LQSLLSPWGEEAYRNPSAGKTTRKEANVAEIRVERKERRSLLPWILGLVLLALVVWGLMEMGDRDRNTTDNGAASSVGVQIPEQPVALRQYALAAVDVLAEAA
jgi:hypothetical protein